MFYTWVLHLKNTYVTALMIMVKWKIYKEHVIEKKSRLLTPIFQLEIKKHTIIIS